jgi:ATP-dependent RNA helicase RhlE
MKKITQTEASSFNGLGIAPKLLEILTDSGFKTPTPIQSQSIPVSLEGKDMVGIAQTGTGKTLAFGIPMIQLIAIHKGMGLVVLPTRELALQVDENLKIIGIKIGLRTAVLIGGEPINNQLKKLKLKPHIIVATPGRLTDHTDRKTVDLSNVKILVLDEADMMLDMGFLPQIKTILKLVPKKRQTMLFSATMPNEIVKIASEYMSLPTRIEVAPAGTSAENVEQELIVLDKASKFEYLKKVLTETKGSVLIFMRTKHAVKTLTKKLALIGFSAAEIHSNRSLGQRRQALDGFKIGKYRILIATDIAARGIDVKEIELVINYDLPEKSGDYVHRIGRTARAGKSGKAISFVMPDQLKNVREIEKLINKTLKIDKTPAELRAMKGFGSSDNQAESVKTVFAGRGRVARQPFRSDYKSRPIQAKSEGEQYNKKTFGAPTSYAKKFKSSDSDRKRTSNNRSGHSFASDNRNRSSISRQIPMTDKERFRRSMMGGGR